MLCVYFYSSACVYIFIQVLLCRIDNFKMGRDGFMYDMVKKDLIFYSRIFLCDFRSDFE